MWQLTDLFNLSFMTGVFPSVRKTAKGVPVFKVGLSTSKKNLCYVLH